MTKTLILAALAAVAVPAATAPVQAQTTRGAPASKPAASGPVTVTVNGLVCDFCVQALTRTFRREKAVDRFHVDLTKREIHMTFKPGQSLSDARIRTLVTNAGYNVVGIARGRA